MLRVKLASSCLTLVAVFAPFTSAIRAQSPAVRVVSVSAPANIGAFQEGGPISVEKRTLRIVLTTPNGREVPAFVVIVRQPGTGLYWWTFQRISASARPGAAETPLPYRLFFASDRVVGFGFATPFLFVREVRGQKADLTAIQQAVLQDIQQRAPEVQDGTATWDREINLVAGSTNRDFFTLAGSASPFPRPKIVGVNTTSGRWEVRLQGPNRDFLRVTLDDQYAVVDVRGEPAPR
jgi:hypothetical protein